MEWRSAEVVRRCKAGEMVCVAWECGLRAAVGAERERGGCARRGKGVRVSVGSACGVEKRAKRVSAFGVIMRAEKERLCVLWLCPTCGLPQRCRSGAAKQQEIAVRRALLKEHSLFLLERQEKKERRTPYFF